MTAFPRLGALAPALLLSTLFLAGCASDEGPRAPTGKPFSRKALLPTLVGHEAFFDGRIVAELKVGAMTGFDPRSRGDGGSGEQGGRRRGQHGGGGFRMGGMGGGGTHPERGGPGANGPGPDSISPEQAKLQAARRAEQMGAPPVMIHLRFTNTGSERADLVVADFLSPLGNFVVSPEKLSLDPGQTVEVEPMTSRLAGEITGGEINLNLRLGSLRETKTITLQAEALPAGPETAPRP